MGLRLIRLLFERPTQRLRPRRLHCVQELDGIRGLFEPPLCGLCGLLGIAFISCFGQGLGGLLQVLVRLLMDLIDGLRIRLGPQRSKGPHCAHGALQPVPLALCCCLLCHSLGVLLRGLFTHLGLFRSLLLCLVLSQLCLRNGPLALSLHLQPLGKYDRRGCRCRFGDGLLALLLLLLRLFHSGMQFNFLLIKISIGHSECIAQ
mmetsp:Transcript_61441/g.101578  ORF Transcript_61441/g.101578 Transcript_61441/m.101578 type:complete len:204 (-) Transcript_61441:2697-3308(-)